jgi:hypothetical protein
MGMNQKTKLILALMQIDNISELMVGNEWEKFTTSHLIPLKYELERQLKNENHLETVGKSNRGESTQEG